MVDRAETLFFPAFLHTLTVTVVRAHDIVLFSFCERKQCIPTQAMLDQTLLLLGARPGIEVLRGVLLMQEVIVLFLNNIKAGIQDAM